MTRPSFERAIELISPLFIPGLVLIILIGNFASGRLERAETLQVLSRATRVEARPQPDDAAVPAPVAVVPDAADPDAAAQPDGAEPAAKPSTTTVGVTVAGTVLFDWRPVEDAAVWVRLIDRSNNAHLVGSRRSTSDGRFEVAGEVTATGELKPVELRIDARKEEAEGGDGEELRGGTTITLGDRPYSHRMRASSWAVFGLPAVFFLSLWVAFLHTKPGFTRRLKYLAALVLAFLFTAFMILGVAKGLSNVQDVGGSWEVLTLGYGFLFRGTYVADGTPEWIYSFTSPQLPETPGDDAAIVAHGFGAPLWVILLSVIGAAVSTVSLLVVGTKDPPDTTSDSDEAASEFRKRIEQIVEHQFFILFAPLGAIFVYQLLVAAEGADRALTVAMAALGSGPVLNYLLARAISQAKSLVQANGDSDD